MSALGRLGSRMSSAGGSEEVEGNQGLMGVQFGGVMLGVPAADCTYLAATS